MNPLASWLNSQPWLRPVLSLVTGAALLVQQYAHNPVAVALATKVLVVTLALGAGSFGQSNSGLSPKPTPSLLKE